MPIDFSGYIPPGPIQISYIVDTVAGTVLYGDTRLPVPDEMRAGLLAEGEWLKANSKPALSYLKDEEWT